MRRKLGTKLTAVICAAALMVTGCGDDGKKVSSNAKPSATVAPTEQPAPTPQYVERAKVDPSLITYADSYSFDKVKYEGADSAEVSILVEAEECEAVEAVSDDKASGSKYVNITDNTLFSIKVDIPASQFYKITATHKAGSHKENPLLFNGEKAMYIVSEEGDFATTTVNGIFLEAGENEITLGEGWSWFSLDSILIENGEGISDDIYNNITDTLSNPYANLKTQNIYQYLKAIYGKRTLAGQCTDYGHDTESDALYKGTGKYPAVRTFDFIFESYSYSKGKPQKKDVMLAKEWSKQGGIVAYDWHWFAPTDESAFYTEKTQFRIPKARTSIDISCLAYEDIQRLFREKKISLDTVMLIHDIDNISSMLQELEDENVTVLWRPLHEASGGWFWWGATGPDDYKWLWKLMYDRMTKHHGLDNLIWVWNAQNGDWYPGDEYCDIVATDIYANNHDYGVSSDTFTELSEWAKNGKLVTMSECATMPDPDLITRSNTYWLWFAVWNGEYLVKNGELADTYTEVDMMKKVYNSDIIITRDELPSFD